MSNPTTKPAIAAFCAVLLAGPALAQTVPQGSGTATAPAVRGAPQTNQPNMNPTANPVQGANTGMARSSDVTSPNTNDPLRSGGQVTDGRSPAAVSGPTGPASTERNVPGSDIALPMGVSRDYGTGATPGPAAPSTAAGHPSGIRNSNNTAVQPGAASVTDAPVTTPGMVPSNRPAPAGASSSAITNQPPGGANTSITNQPPGSAGTSITNAPVGANMDTSQGGRAAAANDSDRRDGTANVAPAAGTSATQVPGANSFTEGQTRSRMEGAGFSQVRELRRDDNGVWRGTAMREGRQVQVSMDYQGNVTHR
ncbi:hypothetical protein [Sabulicella glaciei]|uniref:PepSY domain-containing protein n=1 Tax=Sabulicella glaciei TaxID=2984948 RepID=A0ABT3NUH0_9PROT|nr:hypothetical protein [Roseococcus sp. MDT2-1-1]MCW8085810.1 hypothetical protein [Roseococcus sp. MDT2-1-1]